MRRVSRTRGLGPILTVLAAAWLLSLLWNLPVTLDAFGLARAGALSLEVAGIFAILALVPRLREGRLGMTAAVVVAVATTVVVVLKVADLAFFQILGRPLNPVLDVRLAPSVVHLLTETLGGPLGWTVCAVLAITPFLAGGMVGAVVRRVQGALRDRGARIGTVAAGAALVALFAMEQAWGVRHRIVVNDATLTLRGYARAAEETARGIAEIEALLGQDRFRDVPASRLLSALGGADVLLLFVESYGRSALAEPFYARTTVPALAAFEARLAARGLSAVSGWLTSPTVGGQSWLATGTFTSGLWLPDQGRYDVAMQSARLTLARAFARAGYRTVAFKPAVTRPWPEGDDLGFARVYAAADLGYAGEPYNWVTMPDQYTLSVLERAERRAGTLPLFAEVSLISSHSPWTPVAPVLEDWASIGDGRVFSTWAEEGDPPEVVWNDGELMRVQYGRAVGYVLGVLGSYAARFVDEGTLLIVVGDHQPPFIAGDNAGRDVPIHLISGDAGLLAPFRAWGFTPGMRPSPDLTPKRMDAFRDFFLDAFSPAAEDAAR